MPLVDSTYLQENKDKIKKIFFYRICGAGMLPASIILREKYEVAGGDHLFYPPLSHELEEVGLKTLYLKDISDKELESYDLLVVGNAVAKGGEDAVRLENLNVSYTSFPMALGELILKERAVLGVAGTHGKTTTTYFLTQLFSACKIDSGRLIGGVIEDDEGAKIGKDDHFFIESDEYDTAYFHKKSKFHFYHLKNVILTSLEFDHADIFPNLEKMEAEFEELIPTVTGKIIFNSDYSSVKKVMHRARSSVIPIEYGLQSATSYGPFIEKKEETGTSFSLFHPLTKAKCQFSTNLTGDHNILNLTSALLYALAEQLPLNKLQRAVLEMKMVKRRQEVRKREENRLYIDDFAHHPRAVALTLASLKQRYPHHKLLVVFAPLSATARSNIFQHEFENAIADSAPSRVIVIDPARKTTALQGKDLDIIGLNAYLQKKSINSEIVKNPQEAFVALKEQTNNHDKEVIVVLSNGDMRAFWEEVSGRA